MILEILLANCEPKPQPRVRATRRGAHAGVYDPGTADAFKRAVRAKWREWHGVTQLRGPLDVCIKVGIARPKSHTNKRGLTKAGLAAKPPPGDWDNYAKAVCDALNGVAWADDAQICRGQCSKDWSEGPAGSVYIRVMEVLP